VLTFKPSQVLKNALNGGELTGPNGQVDDDDDDSDDTDDTNDED
jgi:hypothetical protein